MSTLISRLYSWATDKTNSVKITASRMDAENNQIITALNRKVLCAASAPDSPIAGQSWYDTTNKILKLYRDNEWVSLGGLHVAATAPDNPIEGDLFYDTDVKLLYAYDGAAWRDLGTVATHSRREMFCAYASTTTLTVGVGTLEVGGAYITKTSATTLTLSTDANWAGGSSLRAVSTYAYVGVDASGNIKMHTTAPTHSDYAVSVTAGVKRYATWDGTVYRIIGWFRMNATGSGELSASTVSNLKDGDVYNSVETSTTTDISLNDTSYGTDMDVTTMYFYNIGRPVQIIFTAQCDVADIGAAQFLVDVDGTDKTAAETQAYIYSTGGTKNGVIAVRWQEKLAQGAHTIKIQGKVAGGTLTITNWYFEINEA